MPRERHTPEEIITKLRQVDVLVSQGQSVADAVRSIGVTEVTYYRWRQAYGGLKTEQIRRLKELETENARLRRAVADLTLDKLILKEPPRETTEPRASPRLHRARPRQASGLRAPCVPSARPAPLDAAQTPAGPGRRGTAHCRHHRAGAPVRPLRLPQGCRAAAVHGRLGGPRQAGGADLAPRGAQGPRKAGQAWPALAGGRLLPAAAGRVPQPRLVLRLCRGSHPGWTEVPDAQRPRRVHARVPGDPGSAPAQGRGRD